MAVVKETSIQIRMSEDEKAILKALAEQKGLTLSDFVRSICKQAVINSMSGSCNLHNGEESSQNTYRNDVNLGEKNLTLLGGEDWVAYSFNTTKNTSEILNDVAKANNTTTNKMLRTLLLAWLRGKTNNENSGVGGISITPRKRGEKNSVTIGLTLTKNDREAILGYLAQSGDKLTGLMDTLIDTYVKPQHDEPKGE